MLIVVSGIQRSGTSLQMLILKNLGFTIAGEKDPNNRMDLNPTGIWEIPYVVHKGLQKPIEEDVIKLTQSGLEYTTIKYKLIYCIRDPREIVISNRSLIGEGVNDETVWNNYLFESAWAIDNLFLLNSHIVDYGDVIKKPKKEINRLANFLKVNPTKKAKQTPNSQYYRSKKYNIEKNMYAEMYYKYFYNLKK